MIEKDLSLDAVFLNAALGGGYFFQLFNVLCVKMADHEIGHNHETLHPWVLWKHLSVT